MDSAMCYLRRGFSSADVDTCGHGPLVKWKPAPGAAMPEHYDSSSGVTELDTRVSILDWIDRGLRPQRRFAQPTVFPTPLNTLNSPQKTVGANRPAQHRAV